LTPNFGSFDRLIDEAGYQAGLTSSVLQKFRRVCNPHSSGKSWTHVTPAPATLAACEQKARTAPVTRSSKTLAPPEIPGDRPYQQMGHSLAPQLFRPAQSAANPSYAPITPPPSESNNWPHMASPWMWPLAQMDDSRYSLKSDPLKLVTWLQNKTRRLTPSQKPGACETHAQRACFRCRNPGHMKRDC